MPQLDTSHVVATADIDEYLNTRDDFAFELEVFRTCQLSMNASHGGTYSDPITRKIRQYDIRARFDRGDFRLLLAIETKRLTPAFPLVVSTMPRLAGEGFLEVAVSTAAGTALVGASTNVLKRRMDMSQDWFYRKDAPVGKSTAQIGRDRNKGELFDDDSEVFEKWAQAISSLESWLADAEQEMLRQTEPKKFSFALPVLVIPNGTLWVVNYSDKGERIADPSHADQIPAYVGRETKALDAYTISHLHIFTVKGWLAFLQSLVFDRAREGMFPVQHLTSELGL